MILPPGWDPVGSDTAFSIAECNRRLHLFYREQIDEIAAQPDSKLVILRLTDDWETQLQSLTRLEGMEQVTGLCGNDLNEFCEYLYPLQRMLIKYARAKLDLRVRVSDADPQDILPEAMEFLGEGGRIIIFGEVLQQCVSAAHRALADTFDAKIDELKCLK